MVSTTQGDAGFRNHPLYLNGCSTVYNNLNIRHFNISSIKKKHICLHQSQTLNQSEMSAEFLEPAPEPGFWKTTFQQEKLHWSYSWMVHPCISPDPYSMFDFIPVTSFIANNRIYIYTVHSIYIYILVGWWFQPLWKMMEFVSWDDDIPNIWNKKMFQSTKQILHPQRSQNESTPAPCPRASPWLFWEPNWLGPSLDPWPDVEWLMAQYLWIQYESINVNYKMWNKIMNDIWFHTYIYFRTWSWW